MNLLVLTLHVPYLTAGSQDITTSSVRCEAKEIRIHKRTYLSERLQHGAGKIAANVSNAYPGVGAAGGKGASAYSERARRRRQP